MSARMLAALAALLTVTGCSASPAPMPDTEPIPEVVESAPAETPEAAGKATELPAACDAVLSLNDLHSHDARIEMFTELDSEALLAGFIGPMTMATLRGGEKQLYCSWGITGTDGGSTLGAAVISEQAKSELLAALRGSVYVEQDAAGAEARFAQGPSAEHPYTDSIIVDGDLLIAVSGTITIDFSHRAWANIRGL